MLSPGIYRGSCVLRRGVSLLGVAGPDSTILDAGGERYVLFGQGIDSTTVIQGFTIRNGRRDHPNSGGGGVYLYRSSPLILNNVFYDHLGYLGSGVYASHESHPVIAFNVFRDCEGYLGGAIAAYEDCAPLVYNNFLYDNEAVSGGGVLCLNSAPVILRNTIVANVSGSDGGSAIYCDSSPALIEDNVLSHNAGSAAVFWLDDDRPATLRGNLVWQNEGGAHGGLCPEYMGSQGNCAGDPGFRSLSGRDFVREISVSSGTCAGEAGAEVWDPAKPPEVPEEAFRLWREWVRGASAGGEKPSE
jgi:hypothetical protein